MDRSAAKGTRPFHIGRRSTRRLPFPSSPSGAPANAAHARRAKGDRRLRNASFRHCTASTTCAGVAGNYHETEGFFAIKEDPIHRSRNSGYYDNRGGHDRQYPNARPRPPGRLIAKFAELLCRAANAGHMEREIAVQFMSQQAPQTAHLLYMFDDQSGFTAQLPQTVRRIAKIIVRLFV